MLPYVLYFISGCVGLIYEVAWSRMLVLVMGNTTLAAGAILAAFMAGLSLGSLYWGRFIESRGGRALAVFGLLEAGIGLTALALPVVIPILAPLEGRVAGLGQDVNAIRVLIRFLFCFSLLIWPTFLMGGTFAVIGRYTIRRPSRLGRDAAFLYGVNTAGAVLGAFLAGFLLIKHLGCANSVQIAAGLNFFVAAVALLAYFRAGGADPADPPGGAGVRGPRFGAVERTGRAEARLTLLCLGVSGFCALAWPVLWTRLLIPVVDNSVYSFAIILMGFLLGLALG
ncbi:MAG: spermidine synthase, partial [Desulfobacterales bacterium]|nr:spermidine synthase [Desulfobacterales bacterium]